MKSSFTLAISRGTDDLPRLELLDIRTELHELLLTEVLDLPIELDRPRPEKFFLKGLK